MTKLAYLHAIRDEIAGVIAAIEDAESVAAFKQGSVEELLTDLIKSSANQQYQFLTAIIAKGDKK